jgi:hypothetical protein
LALDAPGGLRLSVQDAGNDPQGRPLLAMRPEGLTQHRVFVTAPPGAGLGEPTPVTFRLLDARGRVVAREGSVFLGPKP